MKKTDELGYRNFHAEFLSSVEAGKKYGVTNDYISRLCRQRKLRGFRENGAWIIEADSLEAFFGSNLAQKPVASQTERPPQRHFYTARFDERKLAPKELHSPPQSLSSWSYLAYASGVLISLTLFLSFGGYVLLERNVFLAQTAAVNTSWVEDLYDTFFGSSFKRGSVQVSVSRGNGTTTPARAVIPPPISKFVPAPTPPSIVERVIERIIETQSIVSSGGGLTEEILDQKLAALQSSLTSRTLFKNQTNATSYSIENALSGLGNSFSTVELSVSGASTLGTLSAGTTTLTALTVSGTGTTTMANGIDISDGCFAVDGVCVTGSGSSASTTLLSDTNNWTGLNTFANSSSTLFTSTSAWLTNLTNSYSSSTALTVSGAGYFSAISATAITATELSTFSGGILSAASTTIGGGTQITGLTISGGATTTGNAYFASSIGIGTTSPYRALSVLGAVSTAQQALSYDSGNTTELLTSSVGDYFVYPSGDDAIFNDSNLWVCTGGSGNTNGCPTGVPSGQGNLIVETRLGIASSTPFSGLSIGANGAVLTTEKALTDASTITIDWTQGNQQIVTLGGNRTVEFSNYANPGAILRLVICQDGTGSRTVTWPDGSVLLWAGGTAPTLTTTANKCDVMSFITTSGTSTVKVLGSSVLGY